MKQILYLLTLMLFTGSLFLVADSEEKIVETKLISSVDKLAPGSSNRLALELTVHSPWHVNSNTPSDDFLIPTEVNFKSGEGVAFGKIDYPLGQDRTFAFSDNPVSVYEETVYIYTTISVAPQLAGKSIEIGGTLTCQACNDATCLPPEDLEFSREFVVAEEGETVETINEGIFGSVAPFTDPPLEEKSDLARTIESKGMFWAFIGIFVAGLALNLTPCVYPLIPITISYFGGQAGGKKGNLLMMSLVYVIGMAITYSVLGLFAALTGSILGAWLQNPWVLIFIALVMVTLALGMFGLYEIRVPTSLANFAGQSKQGYFGTLFMGLTVGIIAAPCIGPFVLGLLTYVGELGDPVMGFLMFFVLALGLGVPFVFLAVFSGAINFLPRSGGWMNWVKKIFGFILIGMAFYFLDPLFGSDLWYFTLLGITALLAGVYLAWIDSTQGKGKAFPVVKNLVGIAFMVLGAYFWVSSVEAYVDERLREFRDSAQNAGFALNEIGWHKYSEEKLQTAFANNKPVMIDFYADWCIPCKELDKLTFTDKEVIEMSKKFTMLKADLTKSQSPEVQALQKEYNIKGVPTLVFLTPSGREISQARVVSFVDAGEFLKIMETALEHSAAGDELVQN